LLHELVLNISTFSNVEVLFVSTAVSKKKAIKPDLTYCRVSRFLAGSYQSLKLSQDGVSA
jgi:hypothetical protein